MAESISSLTAKYGPKIEFILNADSNRLNLSPILQVLPSLKQVVTVPTRMNPPATLDTIITTLHKSYKPPYTIPPLKNNDSNVVGKPSDHQIVIWEPLSSVNDIPQRKYKTISFRPMPESSMAEFGRWLSKESWMEIYKSDDINFKTEYFQQTLLPKYEEIFPLRTMRVSDED